MKRFRGLNHSDEYHPERSDPYDDMEIWENENFAMELCSEVFFWKKTFSTWAGLSWQAARSIINISLISWAAILIRKGRKAHDVAWHEAIERPTQKISPKDHSQARRHQIPPTKAPGAKARPTSLQECQRAFIVRGIETYYLFFGGLGSRFRCVARNAHPSFC